MTLADIKDELDKLPEQELDKEIFFLDETKDEVLIEIKDLVVCDEHITLF